MEHQEIKKLISSYYEGVLSEEQMQAVDAHVAACVECRRELEEIRQFEEVMNKMELKKPKPEVWRMYWASVYNRLERRFGWILFSIGAIILLFYGGYKMIEAIIIDSTVPLLLKIGLLGLLAGFVVLLVSVGRERFFVRKRERYKEVEK